ncbi:MAG: AAA family ATPase, partial [bacterium]
MERTGLGSDRVDSLARFQAPLSPDVAARRENSVIEYDRIRRQTLQYIDRYENVVVEGIGGVAVPFTSKYDVTSLIND